MDGEGQPSLGDAAIDMFEQAAAGCVAGDIVRSQQLRKANCAGCILLVFECGRVVGDTANAGFIQLRPRRLETTRRPGWLITINSPRDISICWL